MKFYTTKPAIPLYKTRMSCVKNKHYGLFGGSFNPIHKGHIAIANYALQNTGLDKIIWLVTPQNPFKDKSIYLPYDWRLSKVKQDVNHPNFIISDLENQLQPGNSCETLRYITKRYKNTKFTFMLGSDSLSHMHTWHFFPKLMRMVNFLIIVRPTHRFMINGFGAIRYFKQFNIPYQLILKPFYHISSTQIRAQGVNLSH